MSAPPALSRQALNRATLQRQLLINRAPLSATDGLEILVGMQAQTPDAPYVGLWTRLEGFRPDQLSRLVAGRRAVRVPLLRATIHLVTARDCLAMRPVLAGVLHRALYSSSPFGRHLHGVDVDALLARGRALLEARPRTRAELAPLLGRHWPDHDPVSLAHAVTYLLPVVQVPPRGLWGQRGAPAWSTVEHWLGAQLAPDHRPEQLVLRYLAAYGPAGVADVQTWCGLRRLRAVLEGMRPVLVTFTDERGTELFDLPNAPRPDLNTPVPPRFLPEYDNVLLSLSDRDRILPGDHRPSRSGGYGGYGGSAGSLLLDGFLRAIWRITRARNGATLVVEPFTALTRREREDIGEEGARLLGFVAPDTRDYDVRFTSPD
jgi:hypothetical protein